MRGEGRAAGPLRPAEVRPGDLERIDPAAIHGKRVGEYGAEALVERDLVPSGLLVEKAALEDIILYLSKEETK